MDTFYSPISFELLIEKNKYKFEDSYLDTIVFYMEELDMDQDDIKSLLTPSLITKLSLQVSDLKLIKDDNTIRRTDFDKIF
jgi:predicted RNA-binding protein associated with RNAse of E/G family